MQTCQRPRSSLKSRLGADASDGKTWRAASSTFVPAATTMCCSIARRRSARTRCAPSAPRSTKTRRQLLTRGCTRCWTRRTDEHPTEQRERAAEVHEPAWHPHDQARKLLVLERG